MAGMADQFKGLPMSDLIGGPLLACVDASRMCAQSTADFITQIGFSGTAPGPYTTRQVEFSFERPAQSPSGVITQEKVEINAPLLAIVPIPTFQVQSCTIDFEMEVHEQASSSSRTDMEASLTASAGWGPFKVSITGKASSHKEQARSSDTRAKYTVHVEAKSEGMPEGLARILDMLQDACAPKAVTGGATPSPQPSPAPGP